MTLREQADDLLDAGMAPEDVAAALWTFDAYAPLDAGEVGWLLFDLDPFGASVKFDMTMTPDTLADCEHDRRTCVC